MLLPIVAGVALTVLFCLHALRVERPLLDIRMYANRVFAGAAFTNFGSGAALFGAMILVPLYYQVVRGEDVINTGLLTGPQGIGALVAMPLASRLTERFGGGRVALAGVSVLCLSTIPLRLRRRAHLDRGDLGGAGGARPQHRTVLHARDDRGVRVDAPRPGLRRDAPDQRAAAHSAARSAPRCSRWCCSAPAWHALTRRRRARARSTPPTGGRWGSRR